MAKKTIESLDLEPKIIGSVELSDGSSFNIPKLTNRRLLQAARFLVTDGMEIYSAIGENLDNMSEAALVVQALDGLEDEQVMKLLTILFDVPAEEALEMSPIDTILIVTKYLELVDFKKAFTAVRKLTQMFKPAA